jgi:hypothetical protein
MCNKQCPTYDSASTHTIQPDPRARARTRTKTTSPKQNQRLGELNDPSGKMQVTRTLHTWWAVNPQLSGSGWHANPETIPHGVSTNVTRGHYYRHSVPTSYQLESSVLGPGAQVV